jgi:DNA polymerase-3 subunit delta'
VSGGIEPDQEPGAEHPRRTYDLFGHGEAEARLAAAMRAGRPHHAWMLTGPKGVGKATLAYRVARVMLGARAAPGTFQVDSADPVARRIEQLAHPDLFVMRCGHNERGKIRREITAEEARALGGFFTLQPAEGGWRIAIIDAVDDLNRHAANAILKVLEEPPARALLLLITHAPGAVLPTIRSRVRRLSLRPLAPDAMAAAFAAQNASADLTTAIAMAGGRPGRALALAGLGAHALNTAVEQGLDGLVRGRPLGLMQLNASATGLLADAKAQVLLALLKQAARRAACAGQGLETQAPDWLVKAGRPERAVRWAEAFREIAAAESALQGLDMDPGLAVSRATQAIVAGMA